MSNNLPKSISCRLSDSDMDIKKDLVTHAKDKTERIKAVYRMGLLYEANPNPVTKTFKVRVTKPSKSSNTEALKPADTHTVAFYENRIRALEDQLKSLRSHAYRNSVRHIKEPYPLLYTK